MIPAFERTKTFLVIDRTATVISTLCNRNKISLWSQDFLERYKVKVVPIKNYAMKVRVYGGVEV
jgi:hypothetical protein